MSDMLDTNIAADGWPKVGTKPCPRCGKRTQRQPDQRLYDPVRRENGASSFELHLCVKPKS